MNILHLLRIKMPMSKLSEFKKGISMNLKLAANLDDIPAYLIKKIKFSNLDWSNKPRVATVYCYQPVDESFFSAKEYLKKHGDQIFEMKEITRLSF